MKPAGLRAPTPTIFRSARSPPASHRTSCTRAAVNATASASATGGAPFVGEARVDLVDAAIQHKLASGRTDVITFGSGFVTLKAEPAQLNAELRLDAAQRGLISGRLRADRVISRHHEFTHARAVADGHRRARLPHAVLPGDRSRQRPLRCQPELRRHAGGAHAPAASSNSPAPSSISISSISRCARWSSKRASCRTDSSSVPPRKPAPARWRARARSNGATSFLTAKSAWTARTCASSTCRKRASMLLRISTSTSQAAKFS